MGVYAYGYAPKQFTPVRQCWHKSIWPSLTWISLIFHLLSTQLKPFDTKQNLEFKKGDSGNFGVFLEDSIIEQRLKLKFIIFFTSSTIGSWNKLGALVDSIGPAINTLTNPSKPCCKVSIEVGTLVLDLSFTIMYLYVALEFYKSNWGFLLKS